MQEESSGGAVGQILHKTVAAIAFGAVMSAGTLVKAGNLIGDYEVETEAEAIVDYCCSRSLKRCSFPVCVLGRAVTNFTERGYL